MLTIRPNASGNGFLIAIRGTDEKPFSRMQIKAMPVRRMVVTSNELIEYFRLPSNLLRLCLIGDLTTLYDHLKKINCQILDVEYICAPYDYRVLEFSPPSKVIVKQKDFIETLSPNSIRQLSKANGIIIRCATATKNNIILLNRTGKLLELATHNITLCVGVKKFQIRITTINALRVMNGISRITCEILVVKLIHYINKKIFLRILAAIPSSLKHVIVFQDGHLDVAHEAQIKCKHVTFRS